MRDTKRPVYASYPRFLGKTKIRKQAAEMILGSQIGFQDLF